MLKAGSSDHTGHLGSPETNDATFCNAQQMVTSTVNLLLDTCMLMTQRKRSLCPKPAIKMFVLLPDND